MTSLLALVGIAADPLASREHVLLSNLVENAWRTGRDLDLGTLIGEIQSPPLRKLGVFEIDHSSRPPTGRSSPSPSTRSSPRRRSPPGRGPGARPADASSHSRGQATLRRRLPGAPLRRRAPVRRHARLLEARDVDAGQEGTPDLRALAYMDEVFGYVPPSASPPPKKPILTIFKQGRASGSASCSRPRTPSTWTTRRCRTRARGWSGASRPRTTRPGTRGAPLGERRHGCRGARQGDRRPRQAPVPPRLREVVAAAALRPRWAMSYLAGPLTKEQVARLDQAAPPAPASPPPRRRRQQRRPSSRATRPPSRRRSRPASPSRTSILRRRGRRRPARCPAPHACARSSPHASRSGTTTAPRGSTSSRSSRRCTDQLRRRTRPSRASGRSTTTTGTSAPRPPPARRTSSRRRPSARPRSSMAPRGRSGASSSTVGRSNCSATGS